MSSVSISPPLGFEALVLSGILTSAFMATVLYRHECKFAVATLEQHIIHMYRMTDVVDIGRGVTKEGPTYHIIIEWVDSISRDGLDMPYM